MPTAIKPLACEGCSAPICPMDKYSIKNSVWYPDEEYCKRREYQLDWVKKQKKIAKLKPDPDKYFTVEMLNSIKRVTKGIEGLNPAQPIDKCRKAERTWIKSRIA
jgi:hypothetical protein